MLEGYAFLYGRRYSIPTTSHISSLELLVDTGSSYSFIPRRTLEGLGIRVTAQRPFRLANEERVF